MKMTISCTVNDKRPNQVCCIDTFPHEHFYFYTHIDDYCDIS